MSYHTLDMKSFLNMRGSDSLTYSQGQDEIDAEARLDGIYVVRTNVVVERHDSASVVSTYKGLSAVEREFR